MKWKNDELNLRESLIESKYNAVLEVLAKAYIQSAKKIIKELEYFYMKISRGEGVLQSDLYAYDRYYKLLASINIELEKLGFKQEEIIRQALIDSYLDVSKIVGNQLGFFTYASTQEAISAISTIWVNDGLLWSDRIWNNKANLLDDVMSGLVDIVAIGNSPENIERAILEKTIKDKKLIETPYGLLNAIEQKAFDTAYYNVKRLVRTELKHIEILSSIDQYKRSGVRFYEYLTAEDDKVCNEPEYCKVLNRKIFPIDDTQHLPPQHPNCRCSILPVIE